jgi:hypothetical protein
MMEHATVTDIHPGRLVKVHPPAFGARDVIELAESLIETHGWVKGDGGDASRGWSIHGAIGEAAARATSSQKDSTSARPFRDAAAVLVADADVELRRAHGVPEPARRTEMEINDQAGDVGEVLGVMRAARGAH